MDDYNGCMAVHKPSRLNTSNPHGFATTQWSIVLAAGKVDDREAQDALNQLCESYWYPLYAYVRRRVDNVDDAQDLTQAFFVHLLEKGAVARADRSRGRFRAFLLTAVKNFLANEWQKKHAQKRGDHRLKLSLDYDAGEYGIAVLSRWPIMRDTLIHLAIDPPQPRAGGSYEPRGALRVVVNAPSGALAIVNTHLDASRDDTWRRQEIVTVLAVADSLRRSGLPTLLGGDFNSTPESAVHEAAIGAGLRDAWSVCGRGDSLTFPAGTPVKRIDYLYLSGGASCDEATVPTSQASDHRPLFVRVRL